MVKFDFSESSKTLINHFGITVYIKRQSSIEKSGGYAVYRHEDPAPILVAFSKVGLKEREKLSFDANIFSHILKGKTLEDNIKMGDLFLLPSSDPLKPEEFEVIEIVRYALTNSIGCKIYIGTKR